MEPKNSDVSSDIEDDNDEEFAPRIDYVCNLFHI
jgi:hypothetical protein